MKIKKSKYSIVGYLAILLYLLTHLGTLTLFPLPWYDETYMASIGKAFLETGKFTKTLAYYTDVPKVDLRYGPLYFFVVAPVFKFLGFGIFQYRLISLVFGFVTLWLTFKIYYAEEKNKINANAIVIFLALDSFYFRCMHEGRMDLMASGFMLSASIMLLSVLRTTDKKKVVIKLIFAGVLSALALLTSPRLGYSLPFIGIYLLIHFLRYKPRYTLVGAFSFIIPLFLLYSLWIFYAFGSYVNFIEFYKENLGYTRLNGYPFYIPKQQTPLLLFTFMAVIIGVIRHKTAFFSPLVIWSLLHIAAFYLIVYDNGPYASLIFPYLYILLFVQISPNDWSFLRKTIGFEKGQRLDTQKK